MLCTLPKDSFRSTAGRHQSPLRRDYSVRTSLAHLHVEFAGPSSQTVCQLDLNGRARLMCVGFTPPMCHRKYATFERGTVRFVREAH